jgi:pyruvate formate lyase activating enzyme
VDRMAISGGECTLNRRWLVEYLGLLREQNPCTHLHVDTSGSILTSDYLDDLVQVGMT